MVVTLYLYLLMAARGRPVRRYPFTHTGSDVAAGYQTDAGPDVHTGRIQQCVLYIHDYRYHRLFLRSTVSSWIIQAGGAGAYGQKVGGAGKMAGNGAAAVGGAVGGSVAGRIKKMF